MRSCAIADCPRPVEGRRRYCSRAHQQRAYRARRMPNSRAEVRRRARLEAQRLVDSEEGAALRVLGFDVDLILRGLGS